MKNNQIKQIKQSAMMLIDGDVSNLEYVRGICELIAEIDGVEDVPSGDRATQISKELKLTVNLYPNNISKLHHELA